ncbi:hypothetical protein [Nonomuraea sp. KM88]|uniref:hypothetical protein n=1 Tax=Nonomuraea sp. KM88 TaxID=3457427 RepID=UPI003FCDA19E
MQRTVRPSRAHHRRPQLPPATPNSPASRSEARDPCIQQDLLARLRRPRDVPIEPTKAFWDLYELLFRLAIYFGTPEMLPTGTDVHLGWTFHDWLAKDDALGNLAPTRWDSRVLRAGTADRRGLAIPHDLSPRLDAKIELRFPR